MVTVKQLVDGEARMTPEEKEAITQGMHHELQRALDLVDILRKEGKGLEWDGQAWVIVNVPGINSRLAQELPAKRKRGRRRAAPAIVARDSEHGTVRADKFNHEIAKALQSRNGYEEYPDMGIAERRKMIGYKKDGYLLSTISPFEDGGESSIHKALAALGDGCMDTYFAVQMIAYEKNKGGNLTGIFFATPDDILEMCDKDKSHRAYTPESRLEKINQLKAISQTTVRAEMPGPKKRGKATVYKAEGKLLMLSGHRGQYVTSTGETLWEEYALALGPFFSDAPELNQQTAFMFRKLLAYSGKNERYQKRLGYYLTFMFRTNARRGSTFECSMEKLLEGAGIEPERQVGRFKDAIEQALADLRRDGIIGKYSCIVEASPEVEQHAKGWWDKYAQMKWRFEAPEVVKAQYRRLLKETDLP